MSDFDKLPLRLREELRKFPQNMDAGFALAMLNRGKSEDELISMLHARAKMFGPFNPENVKRGL